MNEFERALEVIAASAIIPGSYPFSDISDVLAFVENFSEEKEMEEENEVI